METLVTGVPTGVVAAATGAVLVLLVVALVTTVLVRSRRRRRLAARLREERRDADLALARAQVEALSRRVEQLGDEVVEARRSRELERDREYVITSLATQRDASDLTERLLLPSPRPALGRLLQDQVVDTLQRQQQRSALRTRAVDVVVRTMAVGHGVRRALSPDVLDRAAAESHVARRQSRRVRRREVREARRFLRAVRTQTDTHAA